MKFIGKMLILLLAFIIGFVSAFGALFGVGYYAYKNISLDKLGVNTGTVFDREAAEVQIGALTIEGLVSELSSLKGLGDDVTLDALVLRYGLIIPEGVDKTIPESARTIPISKLFTKDGITTILDDIYIGQLLGYDKGGLQSGTDDEYFWYKAGTTDEVTGIQSVLVNYTVGELIENKFNTDKIMEELTIAKVLDLHVKSYSNFYIDDKGVIAPVYDLNDTVNIWYNSSEERVSAAIAALADMPVADLSTGVDELSLCSLLGYVSYRDEYYSYQLQSINGEDAIVLTKQTGLTSELSHLTVADFSNGKLDEEIHDIHVYAVFGYTYNEEEERYYDKDGKLVTGVMASIADSTIGDISDEIDNVMIGEACGLVKVPLDEEETEFKWYSTYSEENPTENKEAEGIMAAIADLKIKELKDNDKLVSRIESVTVADSLGYVPAENGKGYVYGSSDPLKAGKPVTGVMAVIADTKLGNIQAKVDQSMIGEVCGFTKVEEDGEVVWYSVYSSEDPTQNKKAGGIMNSIADLTVLDLKDNDKLVQRIQGTTVADALGYELDANGVYVYGTANPDKTGQRVTGVMAVIAGSKLNEIQSTVDESDTGDLMGLTYNEETHKWSDKNGEVHVLMNKIASTPFGEISGITDTLVLSDIIPEKDRKNGFIQLLPGDTNINNIAAKVNEVFDKTTLSEFVEKNIILIDEDKKHVFEDDPNVEGDIGELTIQGLLAKIASGQITIH